MRKAKKKTVQKGDRYGEWSVLDDPAKPPGSKRRMTPCRCSCGQARMLTPYSLLSGASKSCGHVYNARRRTHGMSNSLLYQVWSNMLSKFRHAKTPAGRRYRKLPTRWSDFKKFHADVGDRPSIIHSLVRIDDTKPYSRTNVCWMTYHERNKHHWEKRKENAKVLGQHHERATGRRTQRAEDAGTGAAVRKSSSHH